MRTYLFAGIPTSLWPSSVNATVDGVVLIPTRGVSKAARGGAVLTLCVFDDSWVVSFHDRNTRVGGSEVDTDDAAGKDKDTVWRRESYAKFL